MTQNMSIKQALESIGATPADYARFAEVVMQSEASKIMLLQNIILERQNSELQKKLTQRNGTPEPVDMSK